MRGWTGMGAGGMDWVRVVLVLIVGAVVTGPLFGVRAEAAVPPPNDPTPENVVWDSPSTPPWGTMPLGNGDISVNAWVEADGDLRFYLGKSDSWDSHARLLKVGLVRVALSPNPFRAGEPFRQELRLREGEMRIAAGGGQRPAVRLRVWVDANHPVVRVEGESDEPVRVRCMIEPWRTRERTLSAEEATGSETFEKDGPVVSYPDTVLEAAPEALGWYHRNPRSVWETTLRHQGLGRWIPEGRDPLANRTFGGWVEGEGFYKRGGRELEAVQPGRRFGLRVHLLTAQTASVESWLERLVGQVFRVRAVSIEAAREAHRRWWEGYWDRSWVRVSAAGGEGGREVAMVNRAYVLQRYLNACAGRGAYPIKFNGSLFTVPPPGAYDPDYRRWGGCYWFQNTRLPYWPMLASGDFDLMEPLFRMYREALPMATARTRLLFDHGGAYFAETMHFWGAWHNGGMGWGWDRSQEPPNRALNPYIRFHWSSGLELVAMMLDRESHVPDDDFLRETLLPIADAVLEFYARHYPRQPDGRILFVPAQALETWWEVENPTPEVAGLHDVLARLLSMPGEKLGESRVKAWRGLHSELPPVARRTEGGRTFIVPGEAFRNRQNMENAELYAVFPFRLFGVGKPEVEVGVETFRRRLFPGNVGWQQDEIQAAMLGLAVEARAGLLRRVSQKHPPSRFPAFWGPNFDWVPDQDHGANALMTLQTMILQHEGRVIRLLPAWPKDWDVEFRLYAPERTRVEGVVRGGRWVRLETQPAGRLADVVMADGWR